MRAKGRVMVLSEKDLAEIHLNTRTHSRCETDEGRAGAPRPPSVGHHRTSICLFIERLHSLPNCRAGGEGSAQVFRWLLDTHGKPSPGDPTDAQIFVE